MLEAAWTYLGNTSSENIVFNLFFPNQVHQLYFSLVQKQVLEQWYHIVSLLFQ